MAPMGRNVKRRAAFAQRELVQAWKLSAGLRAHTHTPLRVQLVLVPLLDLTPVSRIWRVHSVAGGTTSLGGLLDRKETVQ